MRTAIILTGLLLAAACGDNTEEEAKKLAQEQADKLAAEKRASSPVTTYKVEVPVVGGHRIDCLDLFPDVKPFSDAISAAEKRAEVVEMKQLDRKEQIKRQPGVNAVCEFRRTGVRPTAEEQKKMSEKTQRLGVLPGDIYCEVRVDCGKPFDENFESNCRKMSQHEVHRDLGTVSCILKTIRAERDAYRYKLYEPDTRCYLDVLGGPSVVDDPIPRGCAQAAIDAIKVESIAKYKNLGPTPADLVEAQKPDAPAAP